MYNPNFVDIKTIERWDKNLKLSVNERIRNSESMVKRYNPDDKPYRSFDSMEEYRKWCEKNLPKYLL